jgi:hypothetical protein
LPDYWRGLEPADRISPDAEFRAHRVLKFSHQGDDEIERSLGVRRILCPGGALQACKRQGTMTR